MAGTSMHGGTASLARAAVPVRVDRGWVQWLWILAAALLGAGTAYVFSDLAGLERRPYLLAYLSLAGAFSVTYLRWARLDAWSHLARNWRWGLLGALLAGGFDVYNVLAQPASATSGGSELVFDLFWEGVLYGVVDALLLTIVPVLAVWGALTGPRWTRSWQGRVGRGAIALAAALAVIVAYHWGYVEFRGAQIVGPMIGNGVLALAYLLTQSPLAPLGGHVAMHVAGVLHGPGSVVQLPPH